MLRYLESMAFGQRLREIMAARGVDQTTLGAALDVTSQAVTQWVNGGTRPRGKRLAEIAQVLDVSAASLMLDVGEPFENPPPTISLRPEKRRDLVDDPDELALLDLWREMEHQDRSIVLRMIRAYATVAA